MEQNIYTGILQENPEKKIQYSIDMTRQYYNLLQTNSGEESAQTYYWDGNVTGMEIHGEENYYLQDDLGSPMQLLNADGMRHETFAYDEFGLSLVDQSQNSQAFGFTGYQTDEVGGLYFAQARRYDAQVGRFVSEDKVRGAITTPYTMNHYVYCWNDPEDYTDIIGVGLDVGLGVVENVESGASTKEFISDAAVDVAISGAMTLATIGASTIASSIAVGAAAGTVVPGLGNVVGAAVGLVVGIGLSIAVDVKEDKNGKTFRDKAKDWALSLFGED